MKYLCNWEAENNTRTNFGHKRKIVFLLHGLAEEVWPCKQDQINDDPKSNWYWMTRKKIDLDIVNGSWLQTEAGSEEDKKIDDWKRS